MAKKMFVCNVAVELEVDNIIEANELALEFIKMIKVQTGIYPKYVVQEVNPEVKK